MDNKKIKKLRTNINISLKRAKELLNKIVLWFEDKPSSAFYIVVAGNL